MNEHISYIIEVQEIDTGINRFYLNEQENLKEIAGAKSLLQKKQESLEVMKQEALELEKNAKLSELNIKSFEDKIAKFTEVQKQIKTNKEYNAMQKSIKDNNTLKTTVEDELIGIMDKQEGIKSLIKEVEEDIKKLSLLIAGKQKNIDEDAVKNSKVIKDLQDKRSGIVKNIKDEYLNVYETIKKNKKFPAIIPVTNAGACTGCFRILPPQQFNELLGGNTFMQCPVCSRILYYKQEEPVL